MSKKSPKTNSKVSKKQALLHPKWDELKKVGFLTLEDIRVPHEIVSDIMETYASTIESDEELKKICTGLDKSYVDCINKCFSIMSQHVDGEFPKNVEEAIANPDLLKNAKFRKGEVGKNITDKDKLYNENLLYHNLHSQYQLLGHEIHSLTHKGKVSMEMRLSAKYTANKTPEEIAKIQEKIKKENEQMEQALNHAKELIDVADQERKKNVQMMADMDSLKD